METTKEVKCVMLGDSATGRTALLDRIKKGFHERKETLIMARPTITLDFYLENVNIKSRSFKLNIIDTNGMHKNFVCYSNILFENCITVLCFSLDDPTSFDNVKKFWLPCIKVKNPNITILLVGTKSDLKCDPTILKELFLLGRKIVTRKMGDQLSREIGAVKYIECLAKTMRGVKILFDKIAYACLQEIETENKDNSFQQRPNFFGEKSDRKCDII